MIHKLKKETIITEAEKQPNARSLSPPRDLAFPKQITCDGDRFLKSTVDKMVGEGDVLHISSLFLSVRSYFCIFSLIRLILPFLGISA